MNIIFEGAYSFYKISEEEFIYLAESYLDIPEPHYIFIVKDSKQELVGFFFAVPDLYNLDKKMVVLKTMGIAPKFRGLNLAEAMFYFVYKNAKQAGFSNLIYSTVATNNERIKSLTGEVIPYRKYEVFTKNII